MKNVRLHVGHLTCHTCQYSKIERHLLHKPPKVDPTVKTLAPEPIQASELAKKNYAYYHGSAGNGKYHWEMESADGERVVCHSPFGDRKCL